MEKIIFTVESTQKKVARFVGNRDLDERAVKAKKNSLKLNGQLIPAVVVDAIDSIKAGLECVDFVTKEAVTSDNASEYNVLVDANHRYAAHLELQNEDPNDKRDFFMMYPLNPEVTIARMLAEINIATNAWKGSAYGKGARMMCTESLPLLDAINDLTSKGYSLDAASKWLTFKSDITKRVLADVMKDKISEKLRYTAGLERGKKLLSAAKVSFSEKTLMTRTLPDWIIGKYENALDPDKVIIVETIESFLKTINPSDVKSIEEAKGKRGESTKEQIIYSKLDDLFSSYNTTK